MGKSFWKGYSALNADDDGGAGVAFEGAEGR